VVLVNLPHSRSHLVDLSHAALPPHVLGCSAPTVSKYSPHLHLSYLLKMDAYLLFQFILNNLSYGQLKPVKPAYVAYYPTNGILIALL